jgi:alpha-L-rhamnosidase
MARAARLLGRPEDERRYALERAAAAQALGDAVTSPPGPGARSQAALAIAWPFAPDAVRAAALWEALRRAVDGGRRFDAGIFGTPAVLEVLNRNGEGDAAVRLLTKPEMPSYRALLDLGATTLWECWPRDYASYRGSMSHPMHAAFDPWLFSDVAGLAGRAAPDGPFEFRAFTGTGLAWARAEREAPEGTVRSSWKRGSDGLVWSVEVPPGTAGRVELPVATDADVARVLESGRPLASSPGVRVGGWSGAGPARRLVVEISSGAYEFRIPLLRDAARK